MRARSLLRPSTHLTQAYPFLFILYILNYVARVTSAPLHFRCRRLGFSNSVFGYGAGIFFIGYFLFQVPLTPSSNSGVQGISSRSA